MFTAIAFYQTVIQGSVESSRDISDSFDIIHSRFTFITNGEDVTAKIFTFGVWLIIGTAVYMLAWFLISFANSAFKDVEVSSSYVHPRSFKKSNFWASIFARIALQACAAISFIIYVSLWLTVLAPAWLAIFREVFISGLISGTIIDLFIGMIGIILSLHIAAIILRVMLLRSKYFYQR